MDREGKPHRPRNVEDLDVFKLAHELTVEIYSVTKGFPKEELYGLVSQLRRSALSINSNLVEGCNPDISTKHRRVSRF